jgi:hypothetical protein
MSFRNCLTFAFDPTPRNVTSRCNGNGPGQGGRRRPDSLSLGEPHLLVILAGGLGTRMSEETHFKPKPMIEIGGKPVLWHIMKMYSAKGVEEFVICCGYKGYLI